MRALRLNRPEAGRHIRAALSDRVAIAFSFNPGEAIFQRRGASLVLLFLHGASIEIPDFFSGWNIPSLSVTLADGTRMDAAELLALFAPHLALPPAAGLSAFTAGAGNQTGGGVDLSALAAEEELLLSPEKARADDSARRNLFPLYQEVIFRDGEITIGPSVYGTLLLIGAETGLHIHLGGNEPEMLDLDDLIGRLPGLFPESPPVRAVAITGGADSRVILDGKRLSTALETVPVSGLGTTLFDRYEYRRPSGGLLALYIETILPISATGGYLEQRQ